MITYIVFWILTLAAASVIRKPGQQLMFLVVVFLFIGFRYETGFDWPVYKDEFTYLSGDFSLAKVQYFSETFQQEYGFVLATAVAAHVFPTYEIYQALITAVFLASVVGVCKTFRVNNYALVLSIALTYLLLTLTFSTVRQCLAVAMFNFGISLFVRGRRGPSVALFALAIMMQVSSILYIAGFAYAVLRPGYIPAVKNVVVLIIVSIVAIGSLPVLMVFLPAYFVERIIHYEITADISAVSLWQIYFVIVFVLIGTFVLFTRTKSDEIDSKTNILRRLVLALSMMSLCSFFINVVRDRLSYELFLLFAVYLASDGLPRARIARTATAAIGLIFSLLNILSPATRLVFIPYQNYFVSTLSGDKGDGRHRQELFGREFERTF